MPIGPASLSSASSPPWSAGVGTKLSFVGVVNVILYSPGTRSPNMYMPLPVVVVVKFTVLPWLSVPVNVTVAPLMPGSPLSCTPSPFLSSHTKSPTFAFTKKPASSVWSSSPLSRNGVGSLISITASASLSTASSVPASLIVSVYFDGFGLMNITLYTPGTRSSNW